VITPPIIIAEGSDVRIYETVAEAIGAIEAIDVDAGVYRAWDSRGHRLALSADPPHGAAITRSVHVALDPSIPDDTFAAVSLLRSVLARYSNVPLESPGSLSKLIEAFVKWQGFS